MKSLKLKSNSRTIRHRRVRAKLFGTAPRPRLVVFRSNKYIYASLIDDSRGHTLATANDHDVKLKLPAKPEFTKMARAHEIGKALAAKAKGLKITEAIFDRGGYRYTGRVSSLAAGARAGGLKF